MENVTNQQNHFINNNIDIKLDDNIFWNFKHVILNKIGMLVMLIGFACWHVNIF